MCLNNWQWNQILTYAAIVYWCASINPLIKSKVLRIKKICTAFHWSAFKSLLWYNISSNCWTRNKHKGRVHFITCCYKHVWINWINFKYVWILIYQYLKRIHHLSEYPEALHKLYERTFVLDIFHEVMIHRRLPQNNGDLSLEPLTYV